MHAPQEGSHDNAKSAVSSFQSLVSNQLAKMEKDFQAGKPFPDLPAIRDVKAFKAIFPLRLLHVLLSRPLPQHIFWPHSVVYAQ